MSQESRHTKEKIEKIFKQAYILISANTHNRCY
jgi:hypothetical protein